ncbi:hypothetical protein COLO4_07409 [Corchorus olitorius]|uniref:Uncharacterized protein n=1 Tax=Corchorus olitorius TaxID=93759 RepID=A0A1R3KK46_9ROSI|nr:hypothetical protein COLO4_07409 [Corchorus olitorius]
MSRRDRVLEVNERAERNFVFVCGREPCEERGPGGRIVVCGVEVVNGKDQREPIDQCPVGEQNYFFW